MNQLAFIKDGKVFTDSLVVAKEFGKTHDHVVRDVKIQLQKLAEAGEEEWGVSNFGEAPYQHPQNKQWYRKYDMTEEAFAIIAMSYITPEAMKMKIRFIEEFKRIRRQLKTVIPNYTPDQAIAVALQKTSEMLLKLPAIESRIDNVEQKLEEQVTLDSGQQEKLKRAVGAKVYSIESAKQYRRQLFAELYSEIKRRWGVPSYRDVRQQDLTGVLRYVDAWKPHTMILT